MRYSHISSQAASAWISLINQHAYLITRSSELVVATLMKTSVYFGQGFAVCSSCNPRLRLCLLLLVRKGFDIQLKLCFAFWELSGSTSCAPRKQNIVLTECQHPFLLKAITMITFLDIAMTASPYKLKLISIISIISYCCRAHLTPYLWMPKWIEASDPSACTLKHHRTSGTETKNGNLCNIASWEPWHLYTWLIKIQNIANNSAVQKHYRRRVSISRVLK